MNGEYLEFFNDTADLIEKHIMQGERMNDLHNHQLQRIMKQCFEAGQRAERHKKVIDKEKRLDALNKAYIKNNS